MELDITNRDLGHLSYCLIMAREYLIMDKEKNGNNDNCYSKMEDVERLIEAVDNTIRNENMKQWKKN